MSILTEGFRIAGKTALLCGLALTIGCGGNTHGGEEEFGSSDFPSGTDATGKVEVRVNDDDMNVGDRSGFHVFVYDGNGAPVQNIQVLCDSELGVAILEPTTGREMTGQFGDISGVIGCASPGSYQFGCRLPLGGNKRQFVTIKCRGTGNAPFPGAAGGGIGGGSIVGN